MKRTVKLTENKLRSMINEAVNSAMNEGMFDNAKAMWQGAKNGRNLQQSYSEKEDAPDDSHYKVDSVAFEIVRQVEQFAESKDLNKVCLANFVIYNLSRYFNINLNNVTDYIKNEIDRTHQSLMTPHKDTADLVRTLRQKYLK